MNGLSGMDSALRDALLTARAVLVIVGPTASGKTALALALAHRFGGEIVSADSRQVYRHLDIGTAKPTVAEQSGIPHHFVDIIDPDEEFNAGMFGGQARDAIDEIFGRGNLPLAVGGSGLYVKSLIDGLFDGPGADREFRRLMEERLERGELSVLIEELRRIDPDAATRIDPTKPRRVIRALEVYHTTGRTMSTVQQEDKPVITFKALLLGLTLDRRELYRRIDKRVDEMLLKGLVVEVSTLLARGHSRGMNALNTVGYAEVFAMLAGEISEAEMVRLIKRNTRHYAKRQLTWFAADRRITWFPADSATLPELITGYLQELVSPSSVTRRST